MQKFLFVKADIFNVKIVTNCKNLKKYINDKIDDFRRLTINFSISTKLDNFDMVFEYYDAQTYKIKYNKNKNTLSLNCPWSKIDQSTVIPMMFRIIVEILRQKSLEIKLHSSAIEKNGVVALILAPSEGGKTTTALSLCQNNGFVMRANDASVVKYINGELLFYRGDDNFRFRLNGVQAYSKEMYNNIKSPKNSKMLWYDKVKISPKDLNLQFKEGTSIVKYIFFVKLDPLINDCVINKYESNNYECTNYWLKYKMQILSNIGGTIRGNDLIPMGNDGEILPLVIPNFDNLILSKRRIKFINNIFNSCQIYQLRGQLDNITDFINNIL